MSAADYRTGINLRRVPFNGYLVTGCFHIRVTADNKIVFGIICTANRPAANGYRIIIGAGS